MKATCNTTKKTSNTEKKLLVSLPVGVKIAQVIGVSETGEIYKLQASQ